MDPDAAPAPATPPELPKQEANTTASAEKPSAPANLPATPTVEEDDDDSEDELDELDDILDEFNDGKSATQSSKGAKGEAIDEDWARMLQEGMADLLSDANESPELQGQFEQLAKELNEAMTSTGTEARTTETLAEPSNSTAEKAPGAAANFQDRIKQTMDRMKSSNAEVDAGLAESDNDDFLAEMLKTMGGSGEGGEEDFSNMLVNMMEQLTSKEILYEPMKELYEKYPEWIRNNEGKESKDDMARYREQYSIVKEIVLKFDEPGYKDEDEIHRAYIVERMQKMQTAGAPPSELMGDMGQGLDPPDIGSDCGVQ